MSLIKCQKKIFHVYQEETIRCLRENAYGCALYIATYYVILSLPNFCPWLF